MQTSKKTKNSPRALLVLVASLYPKSWLGLAPTVGLFFLASLVGEYLLGNVSIRQFYALFFLAPLYGGGALLIREVARQLKRSWPTMILLGLAYGLLEAGLIDQSLFNPRYMGFDFQSAAHIPLLGISAHYALVFLIGHAVWSISVPIAIVEVLVPNRREKPWLGKLGLTVTGLLFLFGAISIFRYSQRTEHFLASVPQLLGAAVVIVALIGTALAVGKPRTPKSNRPIPKPWLLGTGTFVACSLYMLLPEDWSGVVVEIGLLVVITALIMRWSQREGWGNTHRLALAGGALLTYAWVGFILKPVMKGQFDLVDLAGNAIFAAGAVLVLLIAAHKTR